MESDKLQPQAPDRSAAVAAEDKPSRPRRPLGQDGWRNRAICIAAYAVMLLAALIGFDFVRTYGVNIFWSDDWIRVPMLADHFAGTLTPAKFWELHNEHRIVFPRAVMLGLDLLTKGNVVADMYLGEVLLLAILAIMVAAFRRQFGGGPAIWLMAPMAFLVFSLRQYENMLWGFQIGFFMVVAAALAAFLGLSALDGRRLAWIFGGAVLAATVAAFSSIHGLLVWPVGLGQLLVAPLRQRLKIVLAVVWTSVAAAEWSVYFIGWIKPAHHPPLGFSWRCLTSLVGGALTESMTVAPAAGIVLLLLTATAVAIVAAKRQWLEQSFWLATAAFALATLGAITAGRSGFEASQALASRYATATIPLVVAIYVIFASQSAARRSAAGMSLTGIVLLMTVAGTSFSFVEGHREGRSVKAFRIWQQAVVLTMIDWQPDLMIQLYPPSKNVVRQGALVLKKLGYSVFADADVHPRVVFPDSSLPVLPMTTRGEVFDSMSKFICGVMSIRGWAVDWPADDVAGGVIVVIDNVAYPTYYGFRNDEVARMLGSKTFQLCEFECSVPIRALSSGSHRLTLNILSHDGKAVFRPCEDYVFQTP